MTGNLWESENGAEDNDEINLVLPGFNSGWSKTMGFASPSSSLSQSSPSQSSSDSSIDGERNDFWWTGKI